MWRYQNKTSAPGFERQVGTEAQLLAKKEREGGKGALSHTWGSVCPERFSRLWLPCLILVSEVTSSEQWSLSTHLEHLLSEFPNEEYPGKEKSVYFLWARAEQIPKLGRGSLSRWQCLIGCELGHCFFEQSLPWEMRPGLVLLCINLSKVFWMNLHASRDNAPTQIWTVGLLGL